MMMVMPAEMDPGGGADEVEEARHKRRKRSTALVFTEVFIIYYFSVKSHI